MQGNSYTTFRLKCRAVPRILPIAILFVLGSFDFGVYAQKVQEWSLTVDITAADKSTGAILGDVNIRVFEISTDKTVYSIKTPAQGSFKFSVPQNAEYYMTFSRKGYVNKTIMISTTDVPKEMNLKTIFKFELKVEMNRENPCFDFSELKNPVGKIYFISRRKRFDWADFNYSIKRICDENDKPIEQKPSPKPAVKKPTNTINSGRIPLNKQMKKIGVKSIEYATEEGSNFITTKTIVITLDEKQIEYKKIHYNWTGIYYFQNGLPITYEVYKMMLQRYEIDVGDVEL
jgi:hypothetical protein